MPFYLQYMAKWPVRPPPLHPGAQHLTGTFALEPFQEYFMVEDAPNGQMMGYSKSVPSMASALVAV
jgi:hypothetical protein